MRVEHSHPPDSLAEALKKFPCPEKPLEAWGAFKDRHLVRESLMQVQHGLCAYCEVNLSEDGHHIDHVLPKSDHPHLTFEYRNLVLSCIHDRRLAELRKDDISCGHAKKSVDEEFFINPAEEDYQRYFAFAADGRIRIREHLSAEDHAKADHTLKLLNLDCWRLINRRERQLKRFLNFSKQHRETGEERQAWLKAALIESDTLPAFVTMLRQMFAHEME